MSLATTQPATLVALPAVSQSGNNDCGYAALACVALYYKVPGDRLVQGPVYEKYSGPRLSAADLMQMAEMLQLQAFGYQGRLVDLKQHIAKGRPVLVLLRQPPRLGQWPGLEWYGDLAMMPFGVSHWVVVAGFSADGEVILHDPRQGLVSMNEGEFMKLWEQRSRLTVLVVQGRR